MLSDRKILYISSLAIPLALLVALFLPVTAGRIVSASVLLVAAILVAIFLKKRSQKSIYSKQILLIMAASGAVYFVLYFLSSLAFGMTKTGYGFSAAVLFPLSIPALVTIVATEIIRHVLCSQESKLGSVAAYFIALLGELIISATIPSINTMAVFMDFIGLSLFPGIVYNLLYNYLSVRYGFLPNIIYRFLSFGIFFFIPYGSGISDSLVSFFNVIIPIALFFFIDALYEKRKKYALEANKGFAAVLSKVITVVLIVLMAGVVMLVSNQFSRGALVIATTSMTGELNQGDVAIFESYEDQTLAVGQVIVFEKNKSMIVHRIVDIKIVNGSARYYTKGDANEDRDSDYVTDAEVVGIVSHKIPVVGFPTIWMRSLFKR